MLRELMRKAESELNETKEKNEELKNKACNSLSIPLLADSPNLSSHNSALPNTRCRLHLGNL